MKELDTWIEKVEKIISASKIFTEDLRGVIEFLEKIDEENRQILSIVRKKTLDIDVVIEILQYYNIISSNIPFLERKNKTLICKGKFTKTAFDVTKYNIPDDVKETIRKLKELRPE